MPMHNAAATIRSAARTTLRSMPRDSELVVVDDASTDASAEVLATVADPRVRLLETPENLGVAGAINHGLEAVDCELLGRMDADDICMPWRFARQMQRVGAHCDLSFGQVLTFRRTPPRMGMFAPVPISAAAMPYHLVLFNPVAHPTMLATAQVIRDAGGWRKVPAEDYELWMRLVTAGCRMERLGLPLVALRAHASQVTGTADWKKRPPLDGDLAPYRALCRAVVGQDPTWFPNPRRIPQPRRDLLAMADSIRRSSTHLPTHERGILERKLRGTVALAVEPSGATP
jgi:glycosyltransferase involved in cell wall biosynthesis